MNLKATYEVVAWFELHIRELLAQGVSVEEAVRRAYALYPVMQVMADEAQVQIIAEAVRGYGGALPDGVSDRLFTHSWAPDKLTLSERTTRGGLLVRALVAQAIQEQLKKGATYRRTARTIFDGYKKGGLIPEQDLPKFLQEIVAAGRRADIPRAELLRMLKPIKKEIAKRTTAGMRAAYTQLIRAVEAQNEKALENAIYVATQERTRYYAERIARTEMARAYHDGFLARWDANEDCIAYQWRLSGRHPVYDICDLYAKANLYGLGAGIFPKGKVPLIPAHPNCMCMLKPVIRGMLDNETPHERIEDGGREYLQSVSLHHRQMLLGIHGEKAVRRGESWTQKARGYSGAKLKGRLENIPKSLQPFIRDGKINIEDFARRLPDEPREAHERRIWDYIRSPFCTKEFTDRQEIHVKGSALYQEGKSYYDKAPPLKQVIDSLYRGEIGKTKHGDWNKKVLIEHEGINGYVLDNGGKQSTERSTVHLSNKGIHCVPRKGETRT